jgi:hypothetical protein
VEANFVQLPCFPGRTSIDPKSLIEAAAIGWRAWSAFGPSVSTAVTDILLFAGDQHRLCVLAPCHH